MNVLGVWWCGCTTLEILWWLRNLGKVKRIKITKFMKRLAQLSFMTNHMMDAAKQTAEQLRQQITATEEQLQKLKEQLASVVAQNEAPGIETPLNDLSVQHPVTPGKWPLSSEEYKRYGRQMIVPNIGIQGKSHLQALLSILTLCRATSSQSSFRPHSRSRRSRMSSSSIPSRSRSRNNRHRRRRRSRNLKPPSTNPTQHIKSWHEESGFCNLISKIVCPSLPHHLTLSNNIKSKPESKIQSPYISSHT